MRYLIIFALSLLGVFANLYAQGSYTAYGIKGGTTIGFQNWNGQQRQALLEPLGNGSFFIETSLDSSSSLLIETGYHKRGSAIWQREFTYNDPSLGQRTIPATTYKSVFECANLQLAFRKNYLLEGFKTYWLLGVRIEYMFRDSISFHSQLPIVGINTWLYGVTIGGGIEKRIAHSPAILQLELQAQPDFAKQIEQPAYSYYNQYSRTTETFAEQKVINFTGEMTLGIKYAIFDDE
jgi:hypothetical protein